MYFLHSHPGAVPAITDGSHLSFTNRDVEIQFRINGISINPSQIETQPGSSDYRTGYTTVNGKIERQYSDIRSTVNEDFIINQNSLQLCELRFDVGNKLTTSFFKSNRQIVKQSSDPHIIVK